MDDDRGRRYGPRRNHADLRSRHRDGRPGVWAAQHPGILLTTFAEAAAGAELVVNATSGGASLAVKDTDSLGEQIQRAFPYAKVVKTLNTMNAHLMVEPQQLADGDHSVFVSGDDTAAKQTVTDLLRSMGHTDVVDLGDISTARGTEMMLPVWLRLYGALGTPAFNFKIVRG